MVKLEVEAEIQAVFSECFGKSGFLECGGKLVSRAEVVDVGEGVAAIFVARQEIGLRPVRDEFAEGKRVGGPPAAGHASLCGRLKNVGLGVKSRRRIRDARDHEETGLRAKEQGKIARGGDHDAGVGHGLDETAGKAGRGEVVVGPPNPVHRRRKKKSGRRGRGVGRGNAVEWRMICRR